MPPKGKKPVSYTNWVVLSFSIFTKAAKDTKGKKDKPAEKKIKQAVIKQKPKAKPIFTGPRLEIELKSGSLNAATEITDFIVDNIFIKMREEQQNKILKPYSVHHYFGYWDNEIRHMYRQHDTKVDDIYIG